jgi:uncharacterized protein involved in exopolysaccharide biosynthesis
MMAENPRPTLLMAVRERLGQVLLYTVIASALVTAASFLIPNSYTASAVLLPPTRNQGILSLLPGIEGASELGRAIGLGVEHDTDLYVGVLRSRTINRALVDRFRLDSLYHARDRERAGRTLTSHTSITLTSEGFVRVAVTEHGSQLAADLANAYVDELDRFLRLNTNSSARRSRVFLEQRLDETHQTLAAAEDSLRDYQVSQRMPAVGAEVERTANAAADLMAQKALREIELGTLESVARSSNPRAEELRNEIRQFDSEIAKIPPASLGVARLFREVKIQEKILMVLTEQYENARVMELRDLPSVEVVDRAMPPERKSRPRRGFIAAAALVMAFGANVTLAGLRAGAFRDA